MVLRGKIEEVNGKGINRGLSRDERVARVNSMISEQGFDSTYDCLTRHIGLSDLEARIAIFESTGVQIPTPENLK